MRTKEFGLYIHYPWCIKKCPYCDFNSHVLQENLVDDYLHALSLDLIQEANKIKKQDTKLSSIFIGGGTPSLLSYKQIEKILKLAKSLFVCKDNLEVTLEINPGTNEHSDIAGIYAAGVTRLSIGAQSFSDISLQHIGRIHKVTDTLNLIKRIKELPLIFNLDIMYGLPQQSISDAMQDLQTAIAQQPQHISWYEMTIEPNTVFYSYPPQRDQELLYDIAKQGKIMLQQAGYMQYEISAFCQSSLKCWHNVNYWKFGDYIGVGAGAHGKWTDPHNKVITRTWKFKQPLRYINSVENLQAGSKILNVEDTIFEYMLNNLRLYQPIDLREFTDISGIDYTHIENIINTQDTHKLFNYDISTKLLTLSELGRDFTNDAISIFATVN